MTSAVRWDQVSPTHTSTVDFSVASGEWCLLVGPTGSGKSTLLGSINGTTHPSGHTEVCGRDVAGLRPHQLSDVVATVAATPLPTVLADTVHDEVAGAMAGLRLAKPALRQRVDYLLAALGLDDLANAPVETLSDGQQQRVAIALALAGEPEVLVLDEPTSGLDPVTARRVLDHIAETAYRTGTAVVLADPRLERVADFAEQAILLGQGPAPAGRGTDILRTAPLAPPVADLSRLLRWQPIAVTLDAALHAAATSPLPEAAVAEPMASPVPRPMPEAGEPVAVLRSIRARRGGTRVLSGLDLTIRAGEVTAVLGRSGAGKSTLLSVLAGLLRPDQGTVAVGDADPARLSLHDWSRTIGLVPARAGDILLYDRVDRECAQADADNDNPIGRTAFVLDTLLPGLPGDRNPAALSAGEQTALALSVILARNPALVLLDEPTRGLDYAAKERMTAVLRALAATGRAVVVATHDAELVAALADRVVVLGEGSVSADGHPAKVLPGHPVFGTQVAAVLAPAPLLTVEDVRRSLALEGPETDADGYSDELIFDTPDFPARHAMLGFAATPTTRCTL